MLKKFTGLSYGPLLIVLASVLWALDGVVRRSLFSLPPITIVFFEHVIGLLILAPFFWSAWQKEKQKTLSRRELTLISVIALLSGVLGTLFFTTALVKVNFISFSVVFLILYLEPLFAVLSANIFLKEKITTRYALWAGIAIAAVYFATFKNGVVNFQTGAGTVVAALYALGAAAMWGTSTTFSKMMLNKRSDVVVTGLRFLFTSVFAFVGVLLLGQVSSLTAPTASQLGRFVFIALSTGMVALYLYYKGLKKTEAKITTILELVFPFLAVVIDAVVYKTVLAPSQYLAAMVLLYAMYSLSKLSKSEV